MKEENKYTISFVNTVLKHHTKIDNLIRPMKLQKLMYFSHAIYMIESHENGPLFDDQFEKWSYGPVLPDVYYEFSDLRAEYIGRYATITGDKKKTVWFFKEGLIYDVVARVCRYFQPTSDMAMSELTHKAGSPWDQTEGLRSAIDNQLIRDYYSQPRNNIFQ